jgi:hypothetical protein
MAIPDSSPRDFATLSVRNPQRLELLDGTFFPPSCCVILWGRASVDVNSAPRAKHIASRTKLA